MNNNIPKGFNEDGVHTGGMLHGDIEDEPIIKCQCDDPSCPVEGKEGEVDSHIEHCSCSYCHRFMGKISPWM
jgi:hypothetical protein